MKNFTKAFVLFTILFFVNQSWSQCESALTLTPGTPQTGNTSTFGELFSDTCLGNYAYGYDGLFAYTAVETGEELSISLQSSNDYTGISITEGCPSGGTTCIDSDTFGTTTTVDSGALTGGVTYYVHFSTWPSPYDIDYTLTSTLTPAPSCFAPTSLTATSINTTGAIINWVSDGTAFMIEIQPGGVAPGTANGYIVGDYTPYPYTTLDLTGINPDTSEPYLAPNTSYSMYITNVCEYTGGGSTPIVVTDSAVSTALTFTTLCPVINAFPYLESFETITTGQPDCWSLEGTTTSANYHFTSSPAGQTGRGMQFDSWINSSGNTSELITPVVDASTLTSLELNFQYKNPAAGNFEILVSTLRVL